MSDVECPTCGRGGFASDRGVKIHHKQAHGVSIAGVEVTCEQCGGSYGVVPAEVDRSRFCSADCHNQWRGENLSGPNHPMSQKVQLDCVTCDDPFYRSPSDVNKRNFCSYKCYAEWKSEHIRGENHPNWTGGMVTKECEECGGNFEVRMARNDTARFCSYECWGAWASENYKGVIHHNWEGGRFPYGEGWSETKKEDVRERDGRKCQHCGRTEEEHIELFGEKHSIHHIEKARSFENPERRNAMDNLITLCAGKCHKKWERMSPLRPVTGD